MSNDPSNQHGANQEPSSPQETKKPTRTDEVNQVMSQLARDLKDWYDSTEGNRQNASKVLNDLSSKLQAKAQEISANARSGSSRSTVTESEEHAGSPPGEQGSGSQIPPTIPIEAAVVISPQPDIEQNKTRKVNNFGYYLDGWADLVENMGDKVEAAQKQIHKQLVDRGMPEIGIEQVSGVVKIGSPEKRAYTLTTTAPGATTTIYIGKHGADLYASWRTFIRPIFRIEFLFLLISFAVVLGLAIGGRDSYINVYGSEITEVNPTGWVIATSVIFILLLIALGIIGRATRGNAFALFFHEANIFDAEDITAMSLSVHKSMLRALDETGIDISKLRLKQDFQGGRRGEKI